MITICSVNIQRVVGLISEPSGKFWIFLQEIYYQVSKLLRHFPQEAEFHFVFSLKSLVSNILIQNDITFIHQFIPRPKSKLKSKLAHPPVPSPFTSSIDQSVLKKRSDFMIIFGNGISQCHSQLWWPITFVISPVIKSVQNQWTIFCAQLVSHI